MQPRGRPKKYRIVKKDPRISQFSPRGKAGRPDEFDLKMEEFEAVRLADLVGLSQKQAAKSMHISQQTFSRILNKAHRGMADALVNGKAIKIQGGHYVMSKRHDLDCNYLSPMKSNKPDDRLA
jgi:predicted DNA-binding protein (UPF0251 family)